MLTILSQNKEVLFPFNSPIAIEANKKDGKIIDYSLVGWMGDKGITLGRYDTKERAIHELTQIGEYIFRDKNYKIMPQE